MAFLKGTRISTFLFAGVLVYFAVHFFVGQQGVLSWHAYVQRADALMAERDTLTARRLELERRLARYKAGQVDSDYVEERAWSQRLQKRWIPPLSQLFEPYYFQGSWPF